MSNLASRRGDNNSNGNSNGTGNSNGRSYDNGGYDGRMSFWNWFTGPHPLIRRMLYMIGILILLGLIITYLHWVIVVCFILSAVIAYYVFRDAWFEDDSVRAICFSDADPMIIDTLRIGRDLFAATPKTGCQQPRSTSFGAPVYVIESWTDVMKMAWIHEASALEFIHKRQSFDVLSDLAVEAMLAFNRIRHIPYALGLHYGNASINAYERDKLKAVITLDPTDPKVTQLINDLMSVRDPLHAVKSRYAAEEANASAEANAYAENNERSAEVFP